MAKTPDTTKTTDSSRIKPIKIVFFDVDGVLTDGRIIIDDNGLESKFFHVHDGTGIKWLMKAGIEVVLLSGRHCKVTEKRAQGLGITQVHMGHKMKLPVYEQILAKAGLTDKEAAYMGDDILDLPVMQRVNLALAPADARPEVRNAAHYVTTLPGGRGAAREAAELILKGQKLYQGIISAYF
jgi:3-deoxy-D-manno-octulosonate 8-phosphate phosphatase (KDO 8-P phosphatase)